MRKAFWYVKFKDSGGETVEAYTAQGAIWILRGYGYTGSIDSVERDCWVH